VTVGYGTIRRFFRPPRHHAQKKTAHPSEPDRPDILKRREAEFEGQLELVPNAWSSSTRPGLRPTWLGPHGRCPRGERLRVGVPHGQWKTTTFAAGLTTRGMAAPFGLDGPINRSAFETYVERVLSPQLRKGDIVILDNLSSHKGMTTRLRIEAAGASLLHLPPLCARFQSDRERFRQAQASLAHGRRANRRRPLAGHRTPP
jgi:hypothetical protein